MQIVPLSLGGCILQELHIQPSTNYTKWLTRRKNMYMYPTMGKRYTYYYCCWNVFVAHIVRLSISILRNHVHGGGGGGGGNSTTRPDWALNTKLQSAITITYTWLLLLFVCHTIHQQHCRVCNVFQEIVSYGRQLNLTNNFADRIIAPLCDLPASS